MVSGQQTPGVRKFLFRANRLRVPNIKMSRGLRSRPVHYLGTCVLKTAERLQNPIFPAGEIRFFFGSRLCSAVFCLQVPKKCTDLDLGLLYNLI